MFYDQLPMVMPSVVEVEPLAMTLLTYAVPAFEYLGVDQYSEELVRAFKTWLDDWLCWVPISPTPRARSCPL